MVRTGQNMLDNHLCQVWDDLSSFYSGIVVLINQQGLNNHQDLVGVGEKHRLLPSTFKKKKDTALILHWTYLVHIWAHQIIQFVKDAVNNFDQQMAFLVLQCRWHEQWQDLVEQGTCSKLPSLVCDLAQRCLQWQRGGHWPIWPSQNYFNISSSFFNNSHNSWKNS